MTGKQKVDADSVSVLKVAKKLSAYSVWIRFCGLTYSMYALHLLVPMLIGFRSIFTLIQLPGIILSISAGVQLQRCASQFNVPKETGSVADLFKAIRTLGVFFVLSSLSYICVIGGSIFHMWYMSTLTPYSMTDQDGMLF